MRSKALLTLLNSVNEQKLYPNEILIVDGSTNESTKDICLQHEFQNLTYIKVRDEQRGLTKQRNIGIANVSKEMDIVCFLDDDIVLKKNYFKNLIGTYEKYPEAGGVGGYIINEVNWKKLSKNELAGAYEFEIDGYVRNLGLRNILRKKIGLLPNKPPCFMPEYSNGYTVSSLPPSGNVYAAEYFMGGVSSFKVEIVNAIKFSEYFEGYGLYEDMEYCLRVSRNYKLFVNTDASLYHYHEQGGRPNKYIYGKMVVRNGWYVWRTKYSNPSLKARIKWNLILLLLSLLRLSNVVTTNKRKEAFTEFLGRCVGWLSILINKPTEV
jgi:GT2 family glycosyltransferase